MQKCTKNKQLVATTGIVLPQYPQIQSRITTPEMALSENNENTKTEMDERRTPK